jgi:methylenetetrahydrofolate reductase (NADPH)
MKIIDKIKSKTSNTPGNYLFSYEFFPPKTSAGLENLYNRIDRMSSLEPLFIDVTWGAGGSTKELTMTICEYCSKYLGVDTMMHITCQGLTVSQLKDILTAAKDAGICNILALRGELPNGTYIWEPVDGGFNHAIELVQFVRQTFGDHFCIAVAGFPEGHPQSSDSKDEIMRLKEKVDAGADFILTQFFYDADLFIQYVSDCRSAGINVPIIPVSYSSCCILDGLPDLLSRE